MCRFEDLIDKGPLLELRRSINSGDNTEFTALLQKSLSPLVADSKFISFTAWKIDVTGTIYSHATAIEVMDGWKFLINENVPLDIYTKAFYVNSLYPIHNTKENIQANEETDISNILEPETLELLRLCYWINRCKQIITDKKSFENKFIEIKNSLSFQNQIEVRERTNQKLVTFGRIMKDVRIPLWERELHAKELVTELEVFKSTVSSVVPEVMLAALAHEAGFGVSFIPTIEGIKTCDLFFESYKTEVKTFLHTYHEGWKLESNLIKEIVGTLTRIKAVRAINDSLSKKAEIIFIYLTFSSLALGFAKYTFENRINFPLSKGLAESISLAEQNRLKPLTDLIPVVVFTTLIDAVSCDYKIFCYTIPYPVKRKNNTVEADPDNLLVR
jgi:hypothetical protein